MLCPHSWSSGLWQGGHQTWSSCHAIGGTRRVSCPSAHAHALPQNPWQPAISTAVGPHRHEQAPSPSPSLITVSQTVQSPAAPPIPQPQPQSSENLWHLDENSSDDFQVSSCVPRKNYHSPDRTAQKEATIREINSQNRQMRSDKHGTPKDHSTNTNNSTQRPSSRSMRDPQQHRSPSTHRGRRQQREEDGWSAANDPKVLTAQIKAAHTLDHLAAILDTAEHRLNNFHITALLVRLSQLSEQLQLDPISGPTPTRHIPWDEDPWGDEGDGELDGVQEGNGWRGRRRGTNVGVNDSSGKIDDHGITDQDQQDGRKKRVWWRQRQGRGHGNGIRGLKGDVGGDAQRQLQELVGHVLRVLQPVVQELDGRGLVTVLYSLSKLGVRRHPISEDLLYLSTSHLGSYDSQGFSNIIYACALLRLRPPRDWLSAFFRLSLPQLHLFTAQALSNTLWALATLGRAPGISTSSREWEKAMYVELIRVLKSGTCTPQGLSNICWAIARMDLFPPPHVTGVLADSAMSLCKSSSDQGLVNILWGLAKVKAELSTKWWNGLMRVTYSRLEEFSPVCLSVIVYSMALLGQRLTTTDRGAPDLPTSPPNTLMNTRQQEPSHTVNGGSSNVKEGTAAMHQHNSSSGSTDHGTWHMQGAWERHQLQPPLEAVQGHMHDGVAQDVRGAWSSEEELATAWSTRLQECLTRALPVSNAQIVSVVAYSLGKMVFRPEPLLLEVLLSRSLQLMSKHAPQGLTNTMWAFARMGVVPEPLWIQSFMEVSFNVLSLMSQQELTNLIWALSKMKCWPDRLWMAKYDHASIIQLPDYEPEGLSLTLRSFAFMRYLPSTDWQVAYSRQLQSQLLKLTPVQLVDSIWAVAELGVPLPQALLVRMAQGITTDISCVQPRDLASVLYAMARLRMHLPPALVDLFVMDMEVEMDRLDLETLAGAAWALASLGYHPNTRWLSHLDAALLAHLNSSTVGRHGVSGNLAEGNKSSALGHSGPTGGSVQGANFADGVRWDLAQIEALSRLAAARPHLGPAPPPAVAASLMAHVCEPLVLTSMTAPQLLLVLRGLQDMGQSHDVYGEMMEKMTQAAMQNSRFTLGPSQQ